MTNTQSNKLIRGREEKELTQIKRKKRFMFFFPVEWWETVSAEHIGNDIYIMTDRKINNIYINGKSL